MDRDDVWSYFGMVVVAGLLIFGAKWILAEKKVDGYYLSHGGSNYGNAATCVYAHWTWHLDESAFCTDDYQKAVDFAAKATEALHK